MNATTIELIIQGTGVVVAAFGLWYLAAQVKKAADANRTASVMLVLTLEQAVSDNREKLAAVALKALDPKLQSAPESERKAAKLALDERVEEYLNSVDRLCACIIRKHVDEAEYRQDYRNTIIEIVKDYEERFRANSRHRNIIKVHHAWSDDRPATMT